MTSPAAAVSEYEEWARALPQAIEAALVTNDVASTAFYQARRAGWEVEALASDAAFACSRGQGPGALIERLRKLSQSKPQERSTSTGTKQAPPLAEFGTEQYFTVDDPDGERRALMKVIGRDKPSPDAGEAAMVDLISSLRSRFGGRAETRQALRRWRR